MARNVMQRTTIALTMAAALRPAPLPRRQTHLKAATETDETPRRIILFDVMDTLVVDPFFTGVHTVLGCESMQALFKAKRPETYEMFETGEISEDELWSKYFADDRDVDVSAVRKHFVDGYDYIKGMRSLLGEIKRIGNVECYAFSNYGTLYKEIETKLELSKFLEWKFVSCEMGVRKPDPGAFDYVVNDLGVDLQRDVVCFVDDSKTNVAAGNAAGLRSILFEGDSAECRTALIAEGFWELRV
jgi:FMN phosphatase YigB (HAD superfamily)